MAWTTLPAYSDGNALTGAQMNAIADNIEESAAAKATAAGQYFVATAANTLAARTVEHDFVSGLDSDTQTTYDDIATIGPGVTMTCQTQALVFIASLCYNSTTAAGTYMGVDITGATTLAPSDERSLIWQGTASNGERWTVANLYTSLTAGSHTFRSKYKVDSNTGSWKWRRIQVMGF
jgi:hypothetical protein